MANAESLERRQEDGHTAREHRCPLPAQAIQIITAQEAGFLTVTLRSQFDESPERMELEPFRLEQIIGEEKQTKTQRLPRYEQIRGSEISY